MEKKHNQIAHNRILSRSQKVKECLKIAIRHSQGGPLVSAVRALVLVSVGLTDTAWGMCHSAASDFLTRELGNPFDFFNQLHTKHAVTQRPAKQLPDLV